MSEMLPVDRDVFQQRMSDNFVAELLLRGDKTPDEVATEFGTRNAGVLAWLGEARQDEILRFGMQEAGVDLSHWINAEGR
jgi:hypothetical protein